MLKSKPEVPQCPLQIKQDGKFFSRLLAKENSTANTSCRVYYGLAPGSVPFLWESQPGTPKLPISSTTLPPLTPPPSYISNPKKDPTKKQHPKSSLFMTILPKLNMRKTRRPSSSSISSLSSSSFSSAWSFTSSPSRRSCPLSSPRSSISFRADEEDPGAPGSPTSTLCFRMGRSASGSFRRNGDQKVPLRRFTSLSTLMQGPRS